MDSVSLFLSLARVDSANNIANYTYFPQLIIVLSFFFLLLFLMASCCCCNGACNTGQRRFSSWEIGTYTLSLCSNCTHKSYGTVTNVTVSDIPAPREYPVILILLKVFLPLNSYIPTSASMYNLHIHYILSFYPHILDSVSVKCFSWIKSIYKSIKTNAENYYFTFRP